MRLRILAQGDAMKNGLYNTRLRCRSMGKAFDVVAATWCPIGADSIRRRSGNHVVTVARPNGLYLLADRYAPLPAAASPHAVSIAMLGGRWCEVREFVPNGLDGVVEANAKMEADDTLSVIAEEGDFIVLADKRDVGREVTP